jgi:hypothetical protein
VTAACEATVCSCGDRRAHVIARRSTADGKHVALWSDGSLTWALGVAVRGSANPRTPEARQRALAAGWLVLGDVELYDADEVSGLVRAARWSADRGKGRETMLARLNAPAELRPVWRVQEAGRDGKPLVRTWRLPRLRWPGLVVWDEARGSHGRGRYHLLSEVGRSGTLAATGIQFHSLRELRAHLEQLS